jgi:long-chain acyl-CoA synthetase
MFLGRLVRFSGDDLGSAATKMTGNASYDEHYLSKPWLSNYAKGVPLETPALPFENLGHLFFATAAKFGSQTAFSNCLPNGFAGSLTYSQVDAYSNDFAAYLRFELGLAKGDRVAVQMPNCLAWPIAAIGILKSGCVLVNINPLYTESEMEHAFNDSGAKALVIIDLFADKLDRVIPRTQVRHIVLANIADFFPIALRTIVKLKLKLSKMLPKTGLHVSSFTEALKLGAARVPASQDWDRPFLASIGSPTGQSGGQSAGGNTVRLEDVAVLQYTGGTTGQSKGAMLSHRNIIANVAQIEAIGINVFERGKETVLTALPLYHIFAFTANFITFYRLGSHNVLIPNPRPLVNLKKPFEKYTFTSMTGVNTLFNGLADEEWFKKSPPKKLRLCIAGGAALQSAVAEKWKAVSGCEVVEGYGLTESSPVLSFNPIGGGKIKPGTIGLPIPSTILRIVDDEGNSLPRGEVGEIAAKGDQIMLGYWQKPDATAQTIRNGWLLTGDIGLMDEEGYFRIVDRKKDMINVSGFNVYPNEVEDVIAKNPAVAECAVIGVPDAHSGESVRACIVLRPGSTMTLEQLREHCKKSLTGYKLPKQLKIMTELPKTPVGKILRKDLRAMAKKENDSV